MSNTNMALADFKKRRDEARRNYAQALRIISTIDIDILKISDLDSQAAKVTGLAGTNGSIHQLCKLLNDKLDALSPVKAPEEEETPEEIIPVEGEPYELPSEVGVGGDQDLESVDIE